MLSKGKIKHVVFDFDGVIIDSEKKKFSDLKEILKDYDSFLKDDSFRSFIGKKRGKFLSDIGVSNIDEIMGKVHKKDADHSNLRLVEGLIDFLFFLDNKGIKMHIATGSNREYVLSILNKHSLKPYFSEIVTGDEIRESKPSPHIYLEIKRRLFDEDILVIEDSPAGVKSAKKAGLFVIGLGVNLGGDLEFKSFQGIQNYLSL